MPNKVITQVPVVLEDFVEMQVRWDSETTTQLCLGHYLVRDQDSHVSAIPHSVLVPLDQADAATLNGFFHKVMVPAANAQEGT